MDESQLPIDIHSERLLEWLIDRKWVQKDWHTRSSEIRARISDAIKDMPDSDDITALLSGSYINYFHCKAIVEILKVSEAASKNIFGRYSSQRMKDWNEIIRMYELNNVYLAECASYLQHVVTLEIPALKKNIARCQSRIQDSFRKETENNNASKAFQQRFQRQCKEMEIQGVNVHEELTALKSALPKIFSDIADAMRVPIIFKALEYYRVFLAFTLDDCNVNEICPLIAYLFQNGNTSVHKYLTNEDAPPIVTTSASSATQGETHAPVVEIDWGNDDNTTTGEGISINWDDPLPETTQKQESGGVGIDWGDDTVTSSTVNTGLDTVIDWGNVDDASTIAIEVVESGQAEIIRESLLEHSDTRAQIIDEFLELEAFLTVRHRELSKESNSSINIFESAPRSLQSQSAQSVLAMLTPIKAVVALLASNRVQQLVMISSSSIFVDRIAAGINENLKNSERALQRNSTLEQQREELRAELIACEPKIVGLSADVKRVQKQIESDISSKYKGRPVNLVGEINLVK